MESRPESAPRRAAFLWTSLSSSLVAACLNLAASVLAHPRALAPFAGLGLPLAVGWSVLLVAAGVVFASLGGLGRVLGLAPGPLQAALYLAFVLASGLAPLVEVGLRGASSERAAVVLVCALGFVVCAGLFTYLFAQRRGARPESARAALAFLPLASAAVLVALWFVEYRAEGGIGRAGAVVAGALFLVGSGLAARRLAPGPVLAGLAGLVLAHGALDILRGSADSGAQTASSDQPPVILLTVDTLRADRVLGEGAARVPTPAIDALAADSVVFTQARSAAPWTKPSLATLLTGVAPLVHGMTNRRARLPEGLETLAERLRAAGYRTGGVGLNVHLERAFRFDQGFDDYAFPARLDYGIALGARVLARLAPARFPAVYPSTTAIAEVADDWIRAHARAPFFLWVHVLDPHWPYEPPAEWVEHPELEPRSWGEPALVTDVQAGNTKPGQAERERVSDLYAGEIRYVDHELARVLATLRELGLYDRALIVFASDHGEEFWEHGRYEHGHTLYDEVLRVPLLFKLPGADARAHVDAPVSTQALVPTVLDVLGLPYSPEHLSSRSLAPWWRAPARATVEPLFAAGTYYFGEKRGVVFDGWKLVHELDTGRNELYELARDPRELHSLASASPETTARGLELLQAWQERCAALRAELGIADDVPGTADEELLNAMQDLGYGGRDP